MTNILVQLPAEVKEKIERESQIICDKITENLEEQEDPIAQVLKEWRKLYKEEKSTKWFLEHKHEIKVREIELKYEDLLALQEQKINELQTDIINLKRQVK